MTAINYADRLFYNNRLVNAIYAGSTKVWPTWKPTDIAGCAIWIDISQSPNISNGGDVTFLYNRGSGPAPVMWGNPPNPTFRTNALNTTMPVMRITAGQGRFRFTGTGVDKNWTLLYVGRKWRTTPGRVITAASTAANLLVGYHGFEGDVAYVEGWITSPSSPPATTQWKLYSADSASGAVARLFSNGALLASGTATPSLGWGGTLNISGYTDDAAAQEADCEIAEVVMYNRKLSDAERQQVEKYLREKWFRAYWKPTDLGVNLVGWFDSSDVASVQIAGSGVNNWFNRGVSALTVTQGNDLYRPTYASMGGVNFATAQGMNAANSPSSYDVVLVAKPIGPSAAVDWRTMLRSSAGNAADSHQIIIENQTTRFGVYYGGVGFQPAGGLTWGNVDGLAYGRFSNAAPAMLSRDGGALTSTGVTIASTPFVAFGSYQGPPPSQGFGLVKEVIFVPYNSPDDTRQKLEGYLAHKWGLDPLLPAGHPYKSKAP
jgi:hypothetical protein